MTQIPEDELLISALSHFCGIEPVQVGSEARFPKMEIDALAATIVPLPETVGEQFLASITVDYLNANGGEKDGWTVAERRTEEPGIQELKGQILSEYKLRL